MIRKQKNRFQLAHENGFLVLRFSSIYKAPAIETNQRIVKLFSCWLILASVIFSTYTRYHTYKRGFDGKKVAHIENIISVADETAIRA